MPAGRLTNSFGHTGSDLRQTISARRPRLQYRTRNRDSGGVCMSDNNLRPQHQAATSELLRQLLNDDLDQHLTYEQLDDLLDGRLSPAEGATIEGHIARCPACRADLVHLRGIAAQVGGDAEPAQVPLEETTTSGGP